MEKLLCVDDEVRILDALKRTFRKSYHMIDVSCGEEAIKLAEQELPALILLDVQMPGMSGLETCRRIKSIDKLKSIPVIFLTGKGDEKAIEEGFKVGGVDYVTKPFLSGALKARIDLHIRLYRTTQSLVQLNEEKSHYLRMASHDLKNPLSCIRHFNDMIIRSLDTNKDAIREFNRIQTMSDEIASCVDNMLEIVNNLLDIEAIESQREAKSFMDEMLFPVVSQAIQANTACAASKKIEIIENLEEESTLYMHTRRIYQLMDNLISNAVKYSPPSKRIWVRSSKESDYVKIEVKDEGAGIREEEMHKLFKKFSRLSTRPTGDESSTGLGLALAKSITDMHGGKIYCESVFREGAVFVVELPLPG